jgi:hypothetical protein
MSILEKYNRQRKNISDRLQQKVIDLASDQDGAVDKLDSVYQTIRDAYVSGRFLVPKGLPSRPTTWEDGLEALKDAISYFAKVSNFLRTKFNPVINAVLSLASGNRDIDTALDEVQAHNSDPSTLLMVDNARELINMIRGAHFDLESVMEADTLNDPKDLTTSLNANAIKAQLDRAIEAVENIAPYNKIAPNGEIYSDSQTPWVIDLTAEEVQVTSYASATPTGDTALVVPSHAGGSSYYTALSLSDVSAAGYTVFPPKSAAYKWSLVATARALLFNDNGTGAQGDVLAAGNPFASFYAWTAATVAGAAITENTATINNGTALSTTGDETVQVEAELAVELGSSSVTNVSNIVHYDFAFGGVTTAGAAGMALVANSLSFSNVRLIGYPISARMDYSIVTYRDENGVFSINKDDTFIDYFGKLALAPQDDPNFSVPAIMARRLSGKSHQVGAVISVLKKYSEMQHKAGDRIGDKYNRLGCVNGIDDMIGVITYLDRTLPPFGNSLAASITDAEEITFLFSTLITDMKLVRDNYLSDKTFKKYWPNMYHFPQVRM